MSKEIKEALYQQLQTNNPQIEAVIAKYITDDIVKQPILHYIEWLKVNEISPSYSDFEGQSPFWEVAYKGKKHFIVWDGKDAISIMLQATFTNEFQTTILENNLQDTVLGNLQYCSRTNGSNCNNCHLPLGATGVDEIIFGKEIKNLCCGQFITFNNPSAEIIEAIKSLL